MILNPWGGTMGGTVRVVLDICMVEVTMKNANIILCPAVKRNSNACDHRNANISSLVDTSLRVRVVRFFFMFFLR